MDVEKDDIQKSRQEYKAHCPGQKMSESVALKQMKTLVKMSENDNTVLRAEQIAHLVIHEYKSMAKKWKTMPCTIYYKQILYYFSKIHNHLKCHRGSMN